MPQLNLSLFGSFRVTLDGQPVTGFESNKVRALLSYLAVEAQRSHSRSKLAGMLWPEMLETTALANLRYALADLRTAIGDRTSHPPHLSISRQSLQFNTNSENWLDVRVFESLLEASEGNAFPVMPVIQALEIYSGHFLEGFAIPDSIAFEEWMMLKRERLHQLALDSLQRLSNHYEIAGDLEQARIYADRQLELEPCLEEAHRQLMRLMAYRGQRSLAMAKFESCRRILSEELGVEPSEETIHIYKNIRDGKLSVPPSPPAFLWDTQPRLVQPPIFVSRQTELNRLDRKLKWVLMGEGQVTFVIGAPGQGKTALIHEFSHRAQVSHPDLVTVVGSGQVYYGAGDPYLPFREVLEMLTGEVEDRWAAGAISRDHAHRLWKVTPISVKALVENGPALIDTFIPSLGLFNRVSQASLQKPDWMKQLKVIMESRQKAAPALHLHQEDLFNQFGKVLRIISRQTPLLIILDDLQWADRGTLDLLFHLGRQLSGAHILIVGAFRPGGIFTEFPASRHPLAILCNEFQILFGDIFINLEESEGQEFVNAYLDSEPNRLGNAFRDKLYRRTQGTPLFTIELLRGMKERRELIKSQSSEWIESLSIDWDQLPPRVEAAIGERLSWLPKPLWLLIQVASVEGERFTAEVVAQVLEIDENLVREQLSDLLDRKYNLVHAESAGHVDGKSISRYRFHHLLLQMYLYKCFDPTKRAHMHGRIGKALEVLFENHQEEIAVQLAHHFQEAGIPIKAIHYLLLSGNRALHLSANEDAIMHFSEATELIDSLPQSPERDLQELNSLISMSVAFMLARGYASQELGRVCDRMRVILNDTEEKPELFPMLWHLGSYYSMRAEYQTALTLGRKMFQFAERSQITMEKLLANWGLGFILLRKGELEKSLFHLEEVIRNYDYGLHNDLAYKYGTDPLVACLSWSSWTFWMLGYPTQAKQRSQEAISHAQNLSHPGSQVFAHGAAAFLYLFIKEFETALEFIDSSTALAVEYKLPFWKATLALLQGWAQIEQGQLDNGLAKMRQGLRDFHIVGTRESLSLYLSQMANALAQAGMLEEGFGILNEAKAFIQETGERIYQAELFLIQGKMFLMRSQSNQDQAIKFFRKAKEIAIQQKTKSWELRAALCLGRLLQKQGKQLEACTQLAHVYNWFTEGFETPDLQEAHRLLEELNSESGILLSPVIE